MPIKVGMTRVSWAIVALVAVVLGVNGPAPAKQAAAEADQLASQVCAKERKEIGRRAFERKYGAGTDESGSDAMAECVTYTLDSLVQPPSGDEGDEEELA